MPDLKRGASEGFPWMSILTVAAGFAAGGLLLLSPLTSSRPSVPTNAKAEVVHKEDVDARLWQDPFDAVANHKRPGTQYDKDSHYIGNVRREFVKDSIILAVMVNGSAYAEKVERRLRDRVAVDSGLARSGYVPRDSEHIGYFTIPWPRTTAECLRCNQWPSDKPSNWERSDYDLDWAADSTDCTWLEIPFQVYTENALDVEQHYIPREKDRPKKILVLWLRDEFFIRS